MRSQVALSIQPSLARLDVNHQSLADKSVTRLQGKPRPRTATGRTFTAPKRGEKSIWMPRIGAPGGLFSGVQPRHRGSGRLRLTVRRGFPRCQRRLATIHRPHPVYSRHEVPIPRRPVPCASCSHRALSSRQDRVIGDPAPVAAVRTGTAACTPRTGDPANGTAWLNDQAAATAVDDHGVLASSNQTRSTVWPCRPLSNRLAMTHCRSAATCTGFQTIHGRPSLGVWHAIGLVTGRPHQGRTYRSSACTILFPMRCNGYFKGWRFHIQAVMHESICILST